MENDLSISTDVRDAYFVSILKSIFGQVANFSTLGFFDRLTSSFLLANLLKIASVVCIMFH